MQKRLILILTVIVSISGMSQGMLLPLIAFIFESKHIPSHINGLHATSLYIGVFVASFFLEAMLRKLGFKPLIIIGGGMVAVSLLLFPVLDAIGFWFILRLIVGIGDNMLHFSTQSWLTHIIPRHKLGKILSIYGLSFSLGFMVGPLLARLVTIHASLPFAVSGLLTIIACSLIYMLKNQYPPSDERMITFRSTFSNFNHVIKTSWITFLFPMVFGVMESSLNSNFPVFAVKHHLTLSDITWILPSLSLGTILFQIPIGTLSDKMPRKQLMMILTAMGGIIFVIADLFADNRLILMIIFFTAGIFVGSLYSLGVAYMTEITPQYLLPAGNLMCGIAFSIGSICGPIFGGYIIHASHHQSFFVLIGISLVLSSILTMFFKRKPAEYDTM